jgi:FkbM family methyltransferase
LERPALQLKKLFDAKSRHYESELPEIYREPGRIEQIVQQTISPSANCIDIGAHLGSMLSEMVRLAPKGQHMAFEPTPYKAQWLRQKFPEVQVLEVALTDRVGEAKFYLNTDLSGFSGLHQHMAENHTIEELTVQCDCLDHLVPSDQRIDFIKLDVEGDELGVLRGAKTLLQRDQPTILFECTRSGLSSSGYTAAEVFEFLTQLDYSIFLPKTLLENGQPLTFERFQRALEYPFLAFNFFAVG